MSELTDEVDTSENIRLRLAKARDDQAEMDRKLKPNEKKTVRALPDT